jgi:pSer/pThr/pTyr-binding forkhead associated (FHA) protein
MPQEPTKVMPGPGKCRELQQFLDDYDVRLVQVSGDAAGTQFALQQQIHTLGRAPEADVTIDTEAASRRHAAIEFAGGQFRIRDLGSTNGILLNGESVQTAELQHGDQIDIGGQIYRFLCDIRETEPDTYQIDDES